MNKELIKNNKEAFEHWLNGGAIVYYEKAISQWLSADDIWDTVTPADQVKIVINDKYTALRKAVLDDEIIQVQYHYAGCPAREFIDCDFISLLKDLKEHSESDLDIVAFRIKPEPKWYENKTNFPCLVYCEASKRFNLIRKKDEDRFILDKGFYYESDFVLATKEEALALVRTNK